MDQTHATKLEIFLTMQWFSSGKFVYILPFTHYTWMDGTDFQIYAIKVTISNKLTDMGSHNTTSWEALTIKYASLSIVAVIFFPLYLNFPLTLEKIYIVFYIYLYFLPVTHMHTTVNHHSCTSNAVPGHTRARATSN